MEIELQSQFVQRRIQIDAEGGVVTSHLLNRATGTDFLARSGQNELRGPEWSFAVNGELVTSLSAGWSLTDSAQTETNAAYVLTLTFHSAAKALTLTLEYLLYRHYPVMRKRYAIRNDGSAPITLSRLTIESLFIDNGVASESQLSAYYGVFPRELLFTGRVEDTAILLRNSRTDECVFVMNEVPGQLKRTESGNWPWDGSLRLMYDTDLFPFEYRLAAGERFQTAYAGFAFAPHEADLRWIVPSFTSEHLLKKGSRFQPPWLYNTWELFGTRITERDVLEMIPIAARMGFDVFSIDDGWQAEYADNAVSATRFPNGLDSICAAIEAHGMEVGLWVPLSVASENTPIYREHREWACKTARGETKRTETAFGMQTVMCLATPFRQAAAARINALISRYKARYIKLDLTTAFNAYGEAPGCHAEGHDHASSAESIVRIYEGIRAVTDAIYAQHPNVLLDLTFELWGQKHIIDYGLLAAGDLDWLSNIGDASPQAAGVRQARLLLYHRALAIPVETMLIGNLRASTGRIEERFATALGFAPLLMADLRHVSETAQAWYGEKIRWFKALRRAIPIQQSFYPLGNWRQPGALTWDGFARLSREGEGIIVLFKNETTLDAVEVQVPLPGEGHFRAVSAMDGAALGEISSAGLRAGVRIPFPEGHIVQIVELRRQ